MKTLLISYGDVNYDGRLRSLITVFEKIGDHKRGTGFL